MKIISHDSETPAINQQVITACAFIHQQFDGIEKVFLARRASTKKFLPNVYELPGGHIDFGEDIVDGLKRKIKEEFGMNIKVGDPFSVFTYANPIKGSHSLEVIYFASFVDAIEKIKLHPEDHSAFGWFSREEIAKKVIDANKNAEDSEIKGILKGFSLLGKQSLDFASFT
ncbi:MAG: NUDIX hydrolase [Candidatus Levybacteria bacterium]|nr:NUDIX hydrolase [Candidatus Levybacteria bacterium]